MYACIIYIYVCVCVCTTSTYVGMYACFIFCMWACIRVDMFVVFFAGMCVCVDMYIYIHTYQISLCLCICMHVYDEPLCIM